MPKKGLSLLLAAVLLAALVPALWIGAGAAAEPNTIPEIALSVAAPQTDAAPQTEVSPDMTGGGAYSVVAVSWSPQSDLFAPGQVYTVTFRVEPAAGYTFGAATAATVNGAPAECRIRASMDPVTRELSPYAMVSFTFPATEAPAYHVYVFGGTANADTAKVGDIVTVTAGQPLDGSVFAYWSVVSGAAVLPDILMPQISFIMPVGDVTLRVNFKEADPVAVRGDVNGDGKINASDARLALRAAVSLENFAPGKWQFVAADADQNGRITAADARLILRAAVGLENW